MSIFDAEIENKTIKVDNKVVRYKKLTYSFQSKNFGRKII